MQSHQTGGSNVQFAMHVPEGTTLYEDVRGCRNTSEQDTGGCAVCVMLIDTQYAGTTGGGSLMSSTLVQRHILSHA